MRKIFIAMACALAIGGAALSAGTASAQPSAPAASPASLPCEQPQGASGCTYYGTIENLHWKTSMSGSFTLVASNGSKDFRFDASVREGTMTDLQFSNGTYVMVWVKSGMPSDYAGRIDEE